MTKTTRLLLTIFLVAFGSLMCLVGTGTSTEKIAEDEGSQVLERFLGNWETETQIRHTGPPVRQFNTAGKAVCNTTLGGTFYEFRSESVPPGESDLQVMTYDKSAQVYRQWVFSSDGYTHTADGTWNAETSTLLWKGKSGEASFVIEDHWLSPDRLEWTLRRTDARGNVLQTISGTGTRLSGRLSK